MHQKNSKTTHLLSCSTLLNLVIFSLLSMQGCSSRSNCDEQDCNKTSGSVTASSHPGSHQENLATTSSSYSIIERKPHSPSAFTQGWVLVGDTFFESSGLYGQSYLIKYDRENNAQKTVKLPPTHFAEGLAFYREHLYLLTWKKRELWIFDSQTLKHVGTIRYSGEGWGLTHDGTDFLMSDGSDQLYRRSSENFALKGQISVKGLERTWKNINELEFAKGLVWANIWQESLIIAIEPSSGKVLKKFDLSDLVAENTNFPSHQSLNGIAFDAGRDAFWITGKEWPYRYLVELPL